MSTGPITAALPKPIPTPGRNLHFPLVLFIGLQVLDLLTTLLVFAHGGVELNPVVRALMPWTGRVIAVLLCKMSLVAAIWTFSHHRKRVLIIADTLYTAVVIWNTMILMALK